jgi:tRNA dimethylallyltransferase
LEQEAAQAGWPALHARLAEVDPLTAARLEPADAQRIQRALEVYELTGQPMSTLFQGAATPPLPYRLLQIALLPSDRSVLHQRIADRFDLMLEQGLPEELSRLRQHFPELHTGMPSMRCVGYRQAWDYLDGNLDSTGLRDKGVAATRQLAKRQMTWLRSMSEIINLDCLEMNLLDSLTKRVGDLSALLNKN